ncbi:MAG: cytochrome c3 family protein [Blastocatellia bacterium]
MSCHKTHPADQAKHRRLPKTDYCYTCHETEPFKERKKYDAHSATCEY